MNPHITEMSRDGNTIFFTTNYDEIHVVKMGEGVLSGKGTYGIIVLEGMEYEIESDQVELLKIWSKNEKKSKNEHRLE